MRRLLLALLLVAIAAPAAAQTVPSKIPAGLMNRQFDEEIEESTRRWWPDFPLPSWWKAQLWQESRLRLDAVSPVGARGIAQIMPATFRELIRRADREISSPHDRQSIDLGAMYMAQLTRGWKPAGRSARERHLLAMASYNAGAGSIIRAQARCGNALLWRDIQPCLRLVTGDRNAHETTTYVRIIPEWQALVERHWGKP